MATQIIGTVTTYTGTEHLYLTGYRVRIVAVLKAASADSPDGAYIRDDDTLTRAGGITASDRVEVQPWLPRDGRYSFVTSDPKAIDLECFEHLRRETP